MKKMFGFMMIAAAMLFIAACAGGNGNTENPAPPAASNTPVQNEPAEQTAEQAEPADDAEGYSLPIVADGSVTLTVAGFDNWYAPKSYTQNLPVWQEVEKNTGITINWDVTPPAQYGQTMQVRLAAATDLPDILSLPGSPVKYGGDGVIIPLNELIDKYAPNMKAFFEEYPDIYKMAKAPDGNIYAISAVTTGAALTDPYGFLIRKDWLDKLQLQEPTTLDEWYTVLKAFKEQDPNGNGKPDEIPFSPHSSLRGLGIFGNALGLHLTIYSEGYSVDANGKLQYDWLNPKAKDFIVWLNKLYEEGLIDPEFMNKPDDQVLASISQELVGATNGFLNAVDRFNSAVVGEEADWMMTLPPGSGGNQGFFEKYGPISGYWGISKDSEHPEIAIQWLDYIYASEQGARLLAMGVEGISYTMVNGKPEFTEFVTNNPDGLDAASALRSIGAFPTTPWIRAGTEGVFAEQPNALLKMSPNLVNQAKRLESHLTDPIPLPNILPLQEELDELARLTGDIPTYQAETIMKFITGKEPIDWDAFTARMKELGIDKVIALKQKQYDRFNQ